MNKETCLLIILGLIIGFSLRTVIRLINRPSHQNDQTSELRFKFLIAYHFIIFIYAVIILKVHQIYFMVLVTFFVFFLFSISCFLCERMVSNIQKKDYVFNNLGKSMLNLELTYLDLYFMVYMYSLIGLLASGIFILTTQVLICNQQYLYNKYKAKYLKKNNNFQQYIGQECPICLSEYKRQEKNSILQIKNCGHRFHQSCLGQWLQYNDICPLDRKKIFEMMDLQDLENIE